MGERDIKKEREIERKNERKIKSKLERERYA